MFTHPDQVDRDDRAPYFVPRELFNKGREQGFIVRHGPGWYFDGRPVMICEDRRVGQPLPLWARAWLWLFSRDVSQRPGKR